METLLAHVTGGDAGAVVAAFVLGLILGAGLAWQAVRPGPRPDRTS